MCVCVCVLIINTAHDGLSRLRRTSSYPTLIATATERGWRGDDDDDGDNDDDDDGDDDDGEYSTNSSGWRLNCRFRLNYYAKRRSRQATAATAAAEQAVWYALCLIIILIFYISGIKYACTPIYRYVYTCTHGGVADSSRPVPSPSRQPPRPLANRSRRRPRKHTHR